MTNMYDEARREPGRVLYLLALVPPLLGVVAMIAILATQLPKMDDGLEQIVVPGGRSLMLEPGSNTVFLETRSVVDGRVYAIDGSAVSGLAVHVEGADGTPVVLGTPAGTSTYSLNGREGYAINTFRVDRAGTYTVSARYEAADGTVGEGPTTVIAVGQGFFGTLMMTILSALGAMFLSGAVSIGIMVWVWSRRRRAGHSF